jgi:hypothetical protein
MTQPSDLICDNYVFLLYGDHMFFKNFKLRVKQRFSRSYLQKKKNYVFKMYIVNVDVIIILYCITFSSFVLNDETALSYFKKIIKL